MLSVILFSWFLLSCFNHKIKTGTYVQKTTNNISTPDTIFFYDKNTVKYNISNGLMSGVYNGIIDSTYIIIEKECFSNNLIDMQICYDTLTISYVGKNKIILNDNRKFLYRPRTLPNEE